MSPEAERGPRTHLWPRDECDLLPQEIVSEYQSVGGRDQRNGSRVVTCQAPYSSGTWLAMGLKRFVVCSTFSRHHARIILDIPRENRGGLQDSLPRF